MALKSTATIRVLSTKQDTHGVTFPPVLFKDSTFPFQKGDRVDISIVNDALLITKAVIVGDTIVLSKIDHDVEKEE